MNAGRGRVGGGCGREGGWPPQLTYSPSSPWHMHFFVLNPSESVNTESSVYLWNRLGPEQDHWASSSQQKAATARGIVERTYNPNYSEGWDRKTTWAPNLRTTLQQSETHTPPTPHFKKKQASKQWMRHTASLGLFVLEVNRSKGVLDTSAPAPILSLSSVSKQCYILIISEESTLPTTLWGH